MIYQFTGQPGHGKTLSALDLLLTFQDKGRICYVCNVRDFDYEKTGMLKMEPEDFHKWMDFLPDGSVCLVDEVYEKGMLGKLPPSSPVPAHIQKLATHRHRGIDFIFVCQSPDKQCHSFVHDLIDQHTHVRRMFGTSIIQHRIFDRYEAKAERATPITTKRMQLPKRPMGLYKSTELDTTQKRIPWYYWAFFLGIPTVILLGWYVVHHFGERFGNVPDPPAAYVAAAHGAPATGAAASNAAKPLRDYAQLLLPAIDGQPWTAPAFNESRMREKPPRIYCASSGWDGSDSCTCITDQGTKYDVVFERCRFIARNGQLDPFYDPENAEKSRLTGIRAQNEFMKQQSDTAIEKQNATVSRETRNLDFGQMAAYGDHGLAPPGTNSIGK